MMINQPNNQQENTLERWAGSGFPTLALVFTDIIDSTKMADSVGDPKWIEMVLQHFRRGHDLISRHNGRAVKLIGDSFMAVFHNAVDAFGFVIELQEDTGHPNIKVRAGIHVGGVRVIGNDIFGIEVNRAKRVEGMNKHASYSRRRGKGQPLMITISDPAHTQIANEKDVRHEALHFDAVPATLPSFSKQETIWFVYKLNPPPIRFQGRGARTTAQSGVTPDNSPRRLSRSLDSIPPAIDRTEPRIEPSSQWLSRLLKDQKEK